jgi:glutathione S-transferase
VSRGFLAGARTSLSILYLASISFYVGLTSDADEVFAVDGFRARWEQMQALLSFRYCAITDLTLARSARGKK